MIEHEMPLYISTIAVAESCVQGNFNSIPWRNLRILPFNLLHAKTAGSLCAVAFRKKKERGANFTQRQIVPNDTKMFAQAHSESFIHYFISADSEAKKVYDLINNEEQLRFNFIDIRTPFNITFSELF